MYRLRFGRFARDYTVYVINRKRGMAFSKGGAIARYITLDCPETKSALQSTGPLAVARSVIDARRIQESTTGANQ